jgi:formylglycine-generating enzyme required for sulfatase activity
MGAYAMAREVPMKQVEECKREKLGGRISKAEVEVKWFARKSHFLSFRTGGVVVMFVFAWLVLGCAAPVESIETEAVQPSPTSTFEPQKIASEMPDDFGVGQTKVSEKDGMILYYVPAGEFEMGSENHDEDERPVHTVFLEACWIDQTEVTNVMYAKCVADGECDLPASSASDSRESYYDNPEYNDYPVIYVSWDDAAAYCEWADRRLPTEAEWEKAASWDERNRTKGVFPWGDSIDCSFANYLNQGSGCVGETNLVGNYASGRSPYGAYDMVGNVWEWTSSLYRPYPYDTEDGREDPTSLDLRVLRGGSWRNVVSDVRPSNRFKFDHTNSFPYVGFRCADSPEDGMRLVYVPAGEFAMGNTAETALANCQEVRSDCQLDWFKDEEPPHNVYLDAYWIDQTEVTNAMYAMCVEAGA